MRLRLAGPAGFVLAAFLFFGCGNDDHGVNYSFLRSPGLFQSDTAASNHPYCSQANPFGGPEACVAERKYKLSWKRPDDTVNLKGYRIYLDTAPDDMHWGTVQGRPELAAVIMSRTPARDSLIFSFYPEGSSDRGPQPDTLDANEERIVRLDSTGRSELHTGILMFALVPVYGGGVTPGQPQYAYFVTTDHQPPDPFHPGFLPLPHGISIAWARPTDRVSFFDPSLDTGIIAGYLLEVGMDKSKPEDRRKAFRPKLKYYRVGSADSTAQVKDSVLLKDNLPDRVQFFLPDGRRSAKHTHPDATDSLYLEIQGLLPQDSLNFKLWAIDSAGNRNDSAMEKISFRTTDTTQPSPPHLSVDSLGRNGFDVVWTASSDSVPAPGGGLQQGAGPNANIKDYRLSRVLLRAPGERTTGLDRVDTLIQDSLFPTKKSFRLPVRFLPPGTTFFLSIYAEDSSGYPSGVDTLRVTTPKVVFAETDSALVCPPGFVPVPRGTFALGSGGPSPDEQPSKLVAMAPYCIEPYEHRDSTGQRFVSNVTYEQAEGICRAIDPDGFDTRLCSEAEWERACEGPDSGKGALLHGIQSEGGDPSILQTSCNQGTNDSAMAMSFALRNSVCLTTEGIYDLAGNLSEWVRDSYDPRAYDSLAAKATPYPMDHGSVLADRGDTSLHSLRGGNYLKPPNAQTAVLQGFARCSNRDFPEQVRPVFRDECVDSVPMLVVLYGTGLSDHRCYSLEPRFRGVPYTELVPSSKSLDTILAFRPGVARPDSIPFPPDTAVFKGRKPTSARFTTLALAEVVFERNQSPAGQASDTIAYKDTLDATEFRDTTQAGLEKIFRREASNPGWTVRKENGRYGIRYIYAYTLVGSKPARPYYSSRAIGFRCCSRAIRPATPSETVVVNP
jgi:formylglycine-generating enzyme required for sulfatase activity